MKTKFRRILIILLSSIMVIGIFTVIPLTTTRADAVNYIHCVSRILSEKYGVMDNGVGISEYVVRTLSECQKKNIYDGWYYTDKDYKISDCIMVVGETHLILSRGEWIKNTVSTAKDYGEYDVEWFFESENYSSINLMISPGIVHTTISDVHSHKDHDRKFVHHS